MTRLLGTLVLATALALGLPGLASADCTVVHGALVYGADGALSEAPVHLVIDGDTIAARYDGDFPGSAGEDGRGSWNDRDCAWLDATGKQVSRGFVDPNAPLGLVEVGLEAGTRNQDSEVTDPVRASMVVTDAYDPSSVILSAARLHGITSAVVHPTGGMVAGGAGWVDLWGETQADSVVDPVVALRAALTTESRAGGLDLLRDLLADARDYDRNRSSWEQARRRGYMASSRDLEALVPVVRGRIPLVIGADRGSDIEALLRFAAEQDVRLIIDGGAEAHLFAADLAATKTPVIVRPLTYGAGSFDQIRARRDGPKLLAEAGVTILFSSRSAHFARKLRQLAGNAVREGLPHATAMVSLTAGPGVAFGIDGRRDLSVGQTADLVVWSGDPLEISSRPEAMWIGGESAALAGRHEALLERYRTLPGSPVPVLSLPE